MFVVLYRWRIKPHLEQQFIESWSKISAIYQDIYGSLGSRLHRGDDGIFYSYAQWESAEQREAAFRKIPRTSASAKMHEAIEESLPEVLLEITADYLK